MQNKPKSRTDVQWVISSLSLAVTVGLWGLFASSEKRGAGVAGQVVVPPQPQQTDQVVVSQPAGLLPGQKLLFGGTAPQPSQVIVTTRSHGGGGGGAGGGGGGGGGGGHASSGGSHP